MMASVGRSSDEAAASIEALEATRGVVRGGLLLALVLLLSSAWRGSAESAAGTPRWLTALAFGAAALGLWGAAAWGQQRLLLGGRLRRELGRGNGAAALAAAANQIALALITSRAVYGASAGELPAALAFGGLAIVTWGIFVALFRSVTTYADDQEIAGENVAAALSYAGAALALAIIIGHAVDGPFAGWGRSLRAYGAALALAVALYPVRQLLVEGLLLGKRPRLRGGELDRAVGQRRSVGVAAVEAAAYLATALLVADLP
jgi:uncharacterized membrane protein YjfL (UPF0719 family)